MVGWVKTKVNRFKRKKSILFENVNCLIYFKQSINIQSNNTKKDLEYV